MSMYEQRVRLDAGKINVECALATMRFSELPLILKVAKVGRQAGRQAGGVQQTAFSARCCGLLTYVPCCL